LLGPYGSIVAAVCRRGFLLDRAEVKIVTGLDDHSRFCVI